MGKSGSMKGVLGCLAVLTILVAGCSTDEDGDGAASAGDELSGTLVTYNSPTEFANFGEVLAAFEETTGVAAPSDAKNSGQTLAALDAEQGSPQADTAYWGIVFGIQAAELGLVEPYEPEGAADIPDDLKDPDGYWHTVHSGTVAFLVNTDELGDVPVPESWEDLLDPQYEGLVGYLDPTQAAVGYSVATAVNLALGGSLDNFDPGIEYLSELRKNGAVTPAQTATAQLVQGEIPILIDADFNGYQVRYNDDAPVEVVIPEEGSLQIPYTISLVKDAPSPELGMAFIDFLLSDEGQSLFAASYVRPVRGSLPDEIAEQIAPDEDYERAATVDYAKMSEVQDDFVERYRTEVRAG